MFELALRIKRMHKRNGPLFTVMYLKEGHRLTMKQLGGSPSKCETFPRVATRRGLPLIVPGRLRLLIEQNDISVIRAVLSILTVYRVINCASTLKLSTITDPFKGQIERLSFHEIKDGLQMLRLKKLRIETLSTMIPSVKAGPNYKIATLGATLDAKAFSESPELLSYVEQVAAITAPSLFSLLKEEIGNLES